MLKSIVILIFALFVLYAIHPFFFFLAAGALVYYVCFGQDNESETTSVRGEWPPEPAPTVRGCSRSDEATCISQIEEPNSDLVRRFDNSSASFSRRTKTSNSATSPRPVTNFLKLRDQELTRATAVDHLSGYAIPAVPTGTEKVRWVPAGESIEVHGVRISGGMVYVGQHLRAADGAIDPCLIDPNLKINAAGSYRERNLMSYWPRYATISPDARGAYLKWLAQGRSDPAADLGYVFLFFYGLERRAIVELALDRMHATELEVIATEVRRLLGIYGGSRSFTGYAGGFLDLLEAALYDDSFFVKVTASRGITKILPVAIRVALGEASFKGEPISAQLALAWVKGDGQFKRPVEMQRNAEIFEATFLEMYVKKYGAGIKVAPNKTKITFKYHPASSGFAHREQSLRLPASYPDITLLMGPVKQLQQVIDEVAIGIGAYGRYVAKNPGSSETLSALTLLPLQLWPAKPTAELEYIKGICALAPTMITLEDLLKRFDSKDISREQFKLFQQALANAGVGLEPDVLSGARMPKSEDRICVYTLPAGSADSSSEVFMSALVVLEVSSAIAHADNVVTSDEEEHLLRQVDAWPDLNAMERAKLHARARLLIACPSSLAALKTRIEQLGDAVKEAVAIACASMVKADDKIDPGELKILERAYTMLGLDKTRAYAAVQAAAAIQGAAGITATPRLEKSTQPAIQLDLARIKSLKDETTEISALLGAIFVDESAAQPWAVSPIEIDAPAELMDDGFLALDDVHASLARVIVSRTQWNRSELLDIASDLNIMLEGALERINEAAFDQHEMPLTEGDDPIDVNAEILELLQ